MTLEPILQAAWEGLLLVFSWPNILYPVAGTVLAMLFSMVPTLSGVTLMALAIPLTYTWEPVPVLLLFGALVGGATFMGSVTAILLNIPGTSANAATMLDGYPMAQQGRARTAIGCSGTSSALGSTVGIVVLMALIPVIRAVQLAFGPPELLMLAIWGLTALAAFTGGSPVKGLATGGLGLMLAFVGLDPRTAEPRYTFGTLYLQDGVGLVPVFLGVFAVAQIADLVISNRRTISGETRPDELSGSVREGVFSVFRNLGLFLRSSVIGTVVGVIPGVGATVASFIAYGQAVQTGGHGGRFGEGDIRGVLAPEAANDAKDGGSLVPTLAFGIPGGAGTALLLAALTVHGLGPGKAMLTEKLSLAFVLIWSLFLSNWITSLLGLSLINPLVRLTTVRINLLAPPLLGLAALGAYAYRGRLGDVWLTFALGVFGYYLKKHGWPVIPLVIGLVLGRLFEDNLHLTLRLQELDRIDFWTRPISMALLGLTILSLVGPFLWPRTKIGGEKAGVASGSRESRFFTLLLLLLGSVILIATLNLGQTARLAAAWVAIVTSLLLLAQSIIDFRRREITTKHQPTGRANEWSVLLWTLLLPVLTYLLGLVVAVPTFTLFYLKVRSGEPWPKAGLVTACVWAMVYSVLGVVPGIPPQSGWLTDWLFR